MFRRVAVAAASIASGLIVGTALPSYAAGPPYVDKWVDEGSGIAQDYYAPWCEDVVDFEVRFSFHDEGNFHLREHHGEYYGRSTHHGEWTWWNPANGATLVVSVNGLDQDMSVTTGADGTLDLIVKQVSSFVIHTEKGARFLSSGPLWFELHVDPGDPDDPDDDVVTFGDVLKQGGAFGGTDFCQMVVEELG